MENHDLLKKTTRIRIDPFKMKEVLKSDFIQLIGEIKLEMFNVKDRKKLNSVLVKIHNLDLRLDNSRQSLN